MDKDNFMQHTDSNFKVFEDYMNGISIFDTSKKFNVSIEEIEENRRYFSSKYIKYARAINEPLYLDFFEPITLSVFHKKTVLEFINNFNAIEDNIHQIIDCEKLDTCLFVKCRSCETIVEEKMAVCSRCFNNFLEQFQVKRP